MEKGKILDKDRFFTKQKVNSESRKTVDKKTTVQLNKDGTFEIVDTRKEFGDYNPAT